MVQPSFQTVQQHSEDNQSQALSGEWENIHPYMESFGRENAFGNRQQQHANSHHKIHTQNACHNIPRGKTQKAFLQLLTINCNSDNFRY